VKTRSITTALAVALGAALPLSAAAQTAASPPAEQVAVDFSLAPKYLADEPASAAPAAAEAGERGDAGEGGGGKSEEELAKLAQNPVANLISIPFQNNFNFGIGPRDATQWVLNFQPVIPFSLNEDWNVITRTIVPIINQPSPAPGVESHFGIGDINPTFFFSPAKAKGLIWGIGPTLTIPTGSPAEFTSGKWSAGPAAVVLRMDHHWVYGALANHQWSFAGWGDTNVNASLIQPFVNYNLPHGWYLCSSPILTANWNADDSDDIWTVPLGGGFGKIMHVGKLPVNVQLQAFDNVVKPDDTADWQLRFQVQLMFPK